MNAGVVLAFRMRAVLTVVLVALTLAVAGCPKSGGGPAEVCKKVGDQCRLDKNVLGVCQTLPAGAKCLAEPCLVCTSQH